LGKRIAVGADIDSAVAIISGISSALEGAKMVMFGIARHKAMSRTPWWLGPSSPVMPRGRRRRARQVEQSHVEVRLVECPREERRVNRDDGLETAIAMPAAAVTACCSAMPTSKKRLGKRSWNPRSPVGPAMAAVMATTDRRRSPAR